MKKRKIIIVMLLILTSLLVLGLHIIKAYQCCAYYSVVWIGIELSTRFLYDLVLYLILGLIFIVIILILSEKKVKVSDKRKLEIFDLWCKCYLIIDDVNLSRKEKNIELEELFKEYKYKIEVK